MALRFSTLLHSSSVGKIFRHFKKLVLRSKKGRSEENVLSNITFRIWQPIGMENLGVGLKDKLKIIPEETQCEVMA